MHIDDADANFARQTRHRLYSLFTPNQIFIYEKDVTLPACALVPVPHYRINLADSGVRRMAACPPCSRKGGHRHRRPQGGGRGGADAAGHGGKGYIQALYKGEERLSERHRAAEEDGHIAA